MLHQRAKSIYAEKEQLFGDNIRELERIILLRNVDHCWMEQLDAMDDIRGGMGLHSYAQRNPLNEYRIVGAEMFDDMISKIREQTALFLLNINVEKKPEPKQVAKPIIVVEQKTAKAESRVGRNSLCPCGSGKKYKNCCGK